MEDGTARRAQLQRIVEIGDRDLVLASVAIGRSPEIIGCLVRLEPDRFRGVGDDLGVIALLVPTYRAPEVDRRELLAFEHLQRDDLVAGVDHLVWRRGVGRAERPELAARLREGGRGTWAL